MQQQAERTNRSVGYRCFNPLFIRETVQLHKRGNRKQRLLVYVSIPYSSGKPCNNSKQTHECHRFHVSIPYSSGKPCNDQFSEQGLRVLYEFQSLIHQGNRATASDIFMATLLLEFQSLIHQGNRATVCFFDGVSILVHFSFQSLIHQGNRATLAFASIYFSTVYNSHIGTVAPGAVRFAVFVYLRSAKTNISLLVC